MSVFTIFNHGSGGHRDKKDDEIVAYMGRRATGVEYENFLITDGVGGKPKRNWKFWKQKAGTFQAMAGTFDVADRDKSPKQLGDPITSDPSEKGHPVVASLMRAFGLAGEAANVQGTGVFDNAQHAVITIASLDPRPKTINMIGWSRGAITCGVIATLLYDPSTAEGLFRDIDVNIFAIDPVAGGEEGHGMFAESRRSLTPNVKNYISILATGENRNSFSPQDLSRLHVMDPNSTNLVFLPFPGKHSTVAKCNSEKTKAISDIVWSMAHQFFQKFGTIQRESATFVSKIDYLAKYSDIVIHKTTLSRIKQKGLLQRAIGMGFGSRSFTNEMEKYVSNSEYFVNEHHRAIFRVLCPKLFEWLFTRNQFRMGAVSKAVSTDSPIGMELGRPLGWEFFESIKQLGVTFDPGTSGRGRHYKLPAAGACYDGTELHNIQTKADMERMGILG